LTLWLKAGGEMLSSRAQIESACAISECGDPVHEQSITVWDLETRSATDPDCHAVREIGRTTLRIKAQAVRSRPGKPSAPLAITIAIHCERHQLGNKCRRGPAPARSYNVGLGPHRKAVKQIFADVEREPLLAGCLDHEHRLAGVDIFADLANDHADDPVRRRPQDRLVKLPL
jgi:hypothetical protein